MRTDRLHKAGGGLITLIRDNITFTTTDIPSTINTHNIELQMVKVHINNTKHITIANIYIPPRDTTSTQLQNSWHGHTTLHTVHHEHTTLSPSPEVWSTLHSLALVHWRPQRTTNSRCHQQLGPHNTKHKHPNQSAKHHTTTNIITRHHHRV